jgi:hypothetical protein
MTAETSADRGVRRELLRLALHNSARSVVLQLTAVAVVVLIGYNARFAACGPSSKAMPRLPA